MNNTTKYTDKMAAQFADGGNDGADPEVPESKSDDDTNGSRTETRPPADIESQAPSASYVAADNENGVARKISTGVPAVVATSLRRRLLQERRLPNTFKSLKRRIKCSLSVIRSFGVY